MIYLIAAVVIIAVIIEHVKDVRSVKKTEQENEELVKQLEKELEELRKKRVDVDKRFKESYNKYINECESALFPEMHYDTGKNFKAYKFVEREFNELHNRISTIKSEIYELKGSGVFSFEY